ncbi:flagellar assembly peptidoglycan hydrolase FlgJ [Photobacterium galatheae]|uniref:Peptidoglycan hydrolase FlgJ n=1 Tax=Photobacterium galatheae TaxID=1654360 RepID=A0A066S067_9GAMM|nr:flagellar assembly peptidoglycan hydrolase FlgJ [Photobacterium galatheae]KDM93038.1 flagellar rod assembly protein FlgJ [Photobacterium galatheae]MCM0148433.1 flagellar assembly peptidoglycan hydrolase FlgJ [Photobacterium galatheae]
MKSTDPGFINDLANLDRLRAGIKGKGDKENLRAAAEQFEALFTQMLFKSMRQANEVFESDLMSSSNTKFFEEMRDQQMSSELSARGSLGLADLIVEQLAALDKPPATPEAQAKAEEEKAANFEALQKSRQVSANDVLAKVFAQQETEQPSKDKATLAASATAATENSVVLPPLRQPKDKPFASPQDFVSRMRPFAEKAAGLLGTDPAVLIAQAALETGWGKKVVRNAAGDSNNLFNIKADQRWAGNKVATQTLEYHDGIPVQERAAFRSYNSYEDSFNDYVRFLNDNPRYADALASPEDPRRFIRNLHKAGYATDPKYADKIINVMDTVRKLMK